MERKTILITGSEGLIGTALASRLATEGYAIRPLDIRHKSFLFQGDTTDLPVVKRALRGCCGVIHLAAVSRVLWGQQDPKRCIYTNVGGTKNILRAAIESATQPWVVLASSREVYGQPEHLPVTEDAPLRPMNIYAQSKVAAERLMGHARNAGIRTSIVRFSNVYGSVRDHPDRVIPAFVRAALQGTALRLDGAEHAFDFTHVDDVVRGVSALVKLVEQGESRLAAVHLVTGISTTLRELAQLVMELGGQTLPLIHAPARSYDVARFQGDPRRAATLLSWRAQVSLRTGLEKLMADHRASMTHPP
ncbi:MAG: UDP-glucose 4-epimerase [Deltaproteobacteria bacterium ADurb.Bin207]|nr:MAG: UDP-glucose 4-epimerase [Deltaproteobacteria bacterium ADurb.Bin207]